MNEMIKVRAIIMKGKYVKSVEGGGGGLSEYITPLLA
jgi:hypothetical protein